MILPAAPGHPPRRLAPDDERAREVGVDDPPPVGGIELEHRPAKLDPGIVDQDVDRDVRVVEGIEGSIDRGLVRDVEARGADPMARRTHLGDRIREPALVGAVEHDRGAGGRESLGHGAAESAGRSRHESGASGEVKELRHDCSLLKVSGRPPGAWLGSWCGGSWRHSGHRLRRCGGAWRRLRRPRPAPLSGRGCGHDRRDGSRSASARRGPWRALSGSIAATARRRTPAPGETPGLRAPSAIAR